MHYTKTGGKMQGKNPPFTKKSKITYKRLFKAKNRLSCSNKADFASPSKTNFKNCFFD
jgi:hypothetical protein